MAGSTLTVRTLALATVAFALACGHAVQAMGAQKAAAERAAARPAPSSGTVIRVVPAGSGHSTVATYTSSSGGGGGSGGSKVATFTSKSGSAGNSVVTFNGDHLIHEARKPSATPPHPQPTRKPSSPSRANTLAVRGDEPMITVRHSGDPEPAAPAADAPFMGPPAPEPVVAAAKPSRPQIRNVFAGLGTPKSTIEPSAMYAHATAR